MTVRDLLDLLNAAPHDARVYLGTHDGEHAQALRALVLDDAHAKPGDATPLAVYISTE